MTIRNPVEWGWDSLNAAAGAIGAAGRAVGRIHQRPITQPLAVRRISVATLRDALSRGIEDFGAGRTDVLFICLIYPVMGLLLARLALGEGMLPVLFPLVAGFALVGPVAAVGLYEMSRRREDGLPVGWADAFGIVTAPSFAGIAVLGGLLLAIFAAWIGAALLIYDATLGPARPESLARFAHDVLATGPGWSLVIVGCGVGFVFAVAVLAISVISFPLLIDRDIALGAAVRTSVRACIANPGPMAAWGLVVSGGLVLGALPALLGLIVVMPVLGHATWHLYRALVPR